MNFQRPTTTITTLSCFEKPFLNLFKPERDGLGMWAVFFLKKRNLGTRDCGGFKKAGCQPNPIFFCFTRGGGEGRIPPLSQKKMTKPKKRAAPRHPQV